MERVRKTCLTVVRFSLAAWVGAAAMFVFVVLLPLRSVELDSQQKAQLPLLLFPGYYAFGFGLLSTAVACGIIARPVCRSSRLRAFWLALAVLALVTLAADRVWIYTPLASMIGEELATGNARPAAFLAYHQYSRWFNTAVWLLSLLAALGACWPQYGHGPDAGDRRTL